jgi:hypothetical protein
MANYGNLLDEILKRLNRYGDPGIADAAARFSLDRVYFYSQEFFFAGEKQDTSLVLIPGQASYPLPAGTLNIIFVRLNLNGNWIPLECRDIREMLLWDTSTNPPITSPPSYYAMLGNKLRLFPRPDQNYPIELTVESAPLPPRLLTDSNFWTNEAFTLIVEATCADICSLFTNDQARAQAHAMATARELSQLRGQTNRILGPLVIQGWL